MKNLMKTLTILLIVTTILAICNVVFATEDEPIFIPDNEITNTGNNSVGGTNSLFDTTTNNNNSIQNNALINKTTGNNVTNNLVKNTNVNTGNSSIYNKTSNLPKAGSSDSFVLIAIMFIFGLSAIYAFKKIRDYNVK